MPPYPRRSVKRGGTVSVKERMQKASGNAQNKIDSKGTDKRERMGARSLSMLQRLKMVGF